ncbi:DUF7302 family protein [Sphingomonas koreensis]
MKVRAKIALCTPTGTQPRGAEFDTSDEQGARWIAQGKAEAIEDSGSGVAPERAKPKPKARRKPKPKAQPPVVPVGRTDED